MTERINERANLKLGTNRSTKNFAIGEKNNKLYNVNSRKPIKKNYSEDLDIM
jgi:hypothetical protein